MLSMGFHTANNTKDLQLIWGVGTNLYLVPSISTLYEY